MAAQKQASISIKPSIPIAQLAKAGLLMGLVCVLYVGFVVTLFAGFTADIQRDMLSREIATSSPGDLERLILQSFYEADLQDEIKQLQSDIRTRNTAALENFRACLTLRNEAMTAWRNAYDVASVFGSMIRQNRAMFDDDFVAAYLKALAMAHDFIANFQSQPQQQPADQNNAEQNNNIWDASGEFSPNDGPLIIAELHAALAKLALVGNAQTAADISVTVAAEAEQQVYDKAEDVHEALRRYDDKNIRWRVAWENVRAEQSYVDKILRNMQAQIDDIEAELARSTVTKEIDLSALVALFQNPIGGFLSILVQLPTIMLTLLVTVAAGGLGAVVAFTRQNFGRRSKETPPNTEPGPPQPSSDEAASDQLDPAAYAPHTSHTPHMSCDATPDDTAHGLMASARLLMMTGEGIAAAIAIFLFSEAGMLMLTQGGPNGSGQVDISPYLVTFMAFVSGFMAKDAFNRIQLAGKKIFRVQPDDDGNIGPGPSGL